MPALPDVRGILPRPPGWLSKYDDFVTKNASQVSQIESALRSLTYIIPGRLDTAPPRLLRSSPSLPFPMPSSLELPHG